jgi:phage terminase large subunit
MFANAKNPNFDDHGKLQCGVDVARGGEDDTVFVKRKGLKVISQKTIRSKELTPKAKLVFIADELETFLGHDKECETLIDDTGVGGGLTDIMENRKYDITPINFNGVAKDQDKYPDCISEMWFEAAAKVHEMSCPEDSRLQAELVNRKYSLDKKGRRVIESKKDYKKRGFRSPDVADAFLLAFYEAEATKAIFQIAKSPW